MRRGRTGNSFPTKLLQWRRINVESSGLLLAGLALSGILAGSLARLAGAGGLAEILWGFTTALALAPLALTVAADLRSRKLGVDVIALLAMAGSLALGQNLAGAVIALMLSGGQALESFAGARARRDLTSLLERAPRVVHRYEAGHLVSPPTSRGGDGWREHLRWDRPPGA